jgi:hypothetical protein
MSVFETETMAELCIKQGLVSEALAIYRRLVAEAPDDVTRARRAGRLGELERISRGAVAARATPARTTTPPPLAQGQSHALVLEQRGDALHLTWNLPPGTPSPALQLLLLRRGANGIEAEPRTLPLETPSGAATIDASNLHSVHAAAGWLDGSRFVPLFRARLPDGGE